MPVVDGFSVRDWQQFEKVDIDSTSRLTILTGANGSGKTTLLRLLGRHMEWNYPSLGVPTKTPDSGEAHYVVWPPETLVEEPPPRSRPGTSRPNERRVGEVRMAGGERTTVFAPRGMVPTQYVLRVDPNVRIEGVFIPSHQPEFIYRPVENVPVQPRATSQVFSMVNGELRVEYHDILPPELSGHIAAPGKGWPWSERMSDFVYTPSNSTSSEGFEQPRSVGSTGSPRERCDTGASTIVRTALRG